MKWFVQMVGAASMRVALSLYEAPGFAAEEADGLPADFAAAAFRVAAQSGREFSCWSIS